MKDGRKHPVVRSDGKAYGSIREATDDLPGAPKGYNWGYISKTTAQIALACRYGIEVFGYHWQYAEREE